MERFPKQFNNNKKKLEQPLRDLLTNKYGADSPNQQPLHAAYVPSLHTAYTTHNQQTMPCLHCRHCYACSVGESGGNPDDDLHRESAITNMYASLGLAGDNVFM
jgi:hypothetical protein